MRGDMAGSVHDCDLAKLAALIGREQGMEGLLRTLAPAHQFQAQHAVGAVGVRLRGNGAYAALGPGHPGADGEIARLHSHAELSTVGVMGDD